MCENIDKAVQSLPLEKSSWIFVVNENLEILADWIDQITSRNLEIPLVVFTKHLEQEAREKLWQKNIIELVQLPRHNKEC